MKPIRVFDAPVTKKASTAPGKADPNASLSSVIAVAFHPTGKHLAIAGTGLLWWQSLDEDAKPQTIASFQPALSLSRWNRSFVLLTFEDEGKLLKLTGKQSMMGGKQGEKPLAITWRLEMGEKDTTFKEVSREEPKALEAKDVLKIEPVLSPDKTKIASPSSDGKIRITDAKTGKVLQDLQSRE